MKVDQKKKRLKAIKMKYVFYPTRCRSCGEEFQWEKMWQLYRYGVKRTIHKWNYCQNCMHSAEEVLNEVYTDECIFGIVGIEHFYKRLY